MQEDKSIFRVELDEKGMENLRRIHPLVWIIFWSTILLHSLLLYFIIRAALLRGILNPNIRVGSAVHIRIVIYQLYVIFSFVSSFLYCYYFLKFSRTVQQSLKTNDSTSFNQSFRWIYKGLLFAIVTLAITLFHYSIGIFLPRF